MTQVSRVPLPKALESEIFTLFYQALADLHSERDVRQYLDDLLTPTEKTMLGKRLAIAILLEKEYDHRTIGRILKVGLTTISSVHYWLKNKGNGYRNVIGKILQNERQEQTLEKLDTILKKFLTLHKHPYG